MLRLSQRNWASENVPYLASVTDMVKGQIAFGSQNPSQSNKGCLPSPENVKVQQSVRDCPSDFSRNLAEVPTGPLPAHSPTPSSPSTFALHFSSFRRNSSLPCMQSWYSWAWRLAPWGRVISTRASLFFLQSTMPMVGCSAVCFTKQSKHLTYICICPRSVWLRSWYDPYAGMDVFNEACFIC